jgi:hypothetical protein
MTTKPLAKFKANLFKDAAPKYVRCYDDGGKSIDRYTVVFTGRYRRNTGGAWLYLAMNTAPFHPQGFGQHGESVGVQPIDRPRYGHLGKRIAFKDLPDDCRRLVVSDYCDLWETRGAM